MFLTFTRFPFKCLLFELGYPAVSLDDDMAHSMLILPLSLFNYLYVMDDCDAWRVLPLGHCRNQLPFLYGCSICVAFWSVRVSKYVVDLICAHFDCPCTSGFALINGLTVYSFKYIHFGKR